MPESFDDPPGADGDPPAPSGLGRYRRPVGLMVVVIVVAGAGYAIFRDRHSFVSSFRQVGVGLMLASFGCALVGTALTMPMWREVLAGLGVRLPWGAAARVFFTTQLGKYVPGSVWPVLMQMELGRSRGASRRTMLAANVITIIMDCAVGLVLACALLPLSDGRALSRYWWALFALPFLVAMLHPRAITGLLDRLLGLLRRPSLGGQLDLRSAARASGWSLLSWSSLGAHLAILCTALGHGGLSTFLLCTGGMSLAFSLGLLFIPAPAGVGVRDIVLTLVLSAILSPGQAIAVVVASRVTLIACDVALGGLVVVGGRSVRRLSV